MKKVRYYLNLYPFLPYRPVWYDSDHRKDYTISRYLGMEGLNQLPLCDKIK